MQINILNANILTAFSTQTVGTKVLNEERFLAMAKEAISAYDFTSGEVPGQGFVMWPALASFVSAGVGRKTPNPADYVARLYRGQVELFLRREKAAAVEGCALIVYTREAYLVDPDVLKDEAELNRVKESDATHVLVAILAFSGPKAPVSPTRLVHNLAGGNNEALQWTADQIRSEAGKSKEYWDVWCVVAD